MAQVTRKAHSRLTATVLRSARHFVFPATAYIIRIAAPHAGINTTVENFAHRVRLERTPKMTAVFAFGRFNHKVKEYIAQQNIAVNAMSVVASDECASIMGRKVRIAAASNPAGAPYSRFVQKNNTRVAMMKYGSTPIRAMVRFRQ